jgi:hypothetical protein
MNSLALAGAKCRRLVTRQTLLISLAICIVWLLGMRFRGDISHQWSQMGKQAPEVVPETVPEVVPEVVDEPDLRIPPKRMPTQNILKPLSERVPCHGPRGHLLGKSPDDDLEERELDGRMRPSPVPWKRRLLT